LLRRNLTITAAGCHPVGHRQQHLVPRQGQSGDR
jgi:hypothetical protein